MKLADASPGSRTAPPHRLAGEVLRMSEFRAPAELRCIRDLRRYVYAAAGLGAPKQALDSFSIALSELASNVIRHPRPPASQLRVLMELDREGVTASLRCDADSFADRHELITHARPPTYITSGAASGRGLYITLSLFPFLDYQPCSARSDGYECYTLRWAFERRISSA